MSRFGSSRSVSSAGPAGSQSVELPVSVNTVGFRGARVAFSSDERQHYIRQDTLTAETIIAAMTWVFGISLEHS